MRFHFAIKCANRLALFSILFLLSCSKNKDAKSLTIEYRNSEYGFIFYLPADWTNYSVSTGEWKGYASRGPAGDVEVEHGPVIVIQRPPISNLPYQNIPITVFTLKQWNDLLQDKYAVSAGGEATELGRNSKYLFALEPRYNHDDADGIVEVGNLIAQKPLHIMQSPFML